MEPIRRLTKQRTDRGEQLPAQTTQSTVTYVRYGLFESQVPWTPAVSFDQCSTDDATSEHQLEEQLGVQRVFHNRGATPSEPASAA